MKFRVLAGQHIEDGSDGKPRVYRTGDLVDSKTNLVERFNTPSGRKFERVDERVKEDPWEQMTVKDMLQYAADEEIDLKGTTKKEDIIRILRLTPVSV